MSGVFFTKQLKHCIPEAIKTVATLWFFVVMPASVYLFYVDLPFHNLWVYDFFYESKFTIIFLHVVLLIFFLKKATGKADRIVSLKDPLNRRYSELFLGLINEELHSIFSNRNNLPIGDPGIFIGDIPSRSAMMTPHIDPSLLYTPTSIYATSSDRASVIGPPGTGKTTFMINQIFKWSDTGNSLIAIDIKPEIEKITRKRLEDAGYKILVFNPSNHKDVYNMLDDLKESEAIAELAASIIPTTGESDNAVFTESARDLLDALVRHVKTVDPNASLPALVDFLSEFENTKDILDTLAKSPSKDAQSITKSIKMMSGSERLLASIFATMLANLRFLRFTNARKSLGRNGFSLHDLQAGKVALFIQFEEKDRAHFALFFSVFVGHVLRFFIQHHEDRNPILLLLDEIGTAETVHDLKGKLNTIRSRKLPTWLYWQSKEQMQKYGQKANEGPNIILGACDVQIVFRLNDNETAQWFSERVGKIDRTREICSTSRTSGRDSESSTASTVYQIERDNWIDGSDLMQLPDGDALFLYKGIAWIGRATPFYENGDNV